jgi:selT/selW/selH-like putative selenoprotein
LGAELSEVFGAEVELATGDGGAFDVIVDGQTIFSKNKEGRFPEDGEIAKLIRRG